MLESHYRDQQHATIVRFNQNDLVADREKEALIRQQGSRLAEQFRELGAQQTELLRHQQFNEAVGWTTHTRRAEILKVDIFKNRGVEEDSLLLLFIELDRAIKTRCIDDEQMKLIFAQAHLAGRAKTWAL